MGTTKRDVSGVFDTEIRRPPARKPAVLDQIFQISPKGITFVTEQYLPEWTEVGVEMRLPGAGARKDHPIDCRGVVVQCARRQHGRGFEVALLFLNLSKRAQAQLSVPPSSLGPTSISISR